MTDPTSHPVAPAYPATPTYGPPAHATSQGNLTGAGSSSPVRGSGQARLGAAGQPPATNHGTPSGLTKPSTRSRSGPWLSVGLAVSFNLVSLLGVTIFGWPAGNVFLLFWAENAVLGVFTLVKVATAAVPSPQGSLRFNNRPTSSSPTLFAIFFTFHYGLFCVVHLVFTAIVAYKIGFELSFFYLGFPVILMVIRYTVETLTTWFAPGGQRWTTSSATAMVQPYPRIIVLHFAVIVGFIVVLGGLVEQDWLRRARDIVDPVLAALPAGWQSQGVLLVVVLLGIKTVVDVFTTLRATRTR